MNLEQQVTSLELSKRLEELGVKQESIFYWDADEEDNWQIIPTISFSSRNAIIKLSVDRVDSVSAFTVAELGEMLPDHVIVQPSNVQSIRCTKRGTLYRVHLGTTYQPTSHNEADARAKMLIYLLENKLFIV